jgi:hypothetical protein
LTVVCSDWTYRGGGWGERGEKGEGRGEGRRGERGEGIGERGERGNFFICVDDVNGISPSIMGRENLD